MVYNIRDTTAVVAWPLIPTLLGLSVHASYSLSLSLSLIHARGDVSLLQSSLIVVDNLLPSVHLSAGRSGSSLVPDGQSVTAAKARVNCPTHVLHAACQHWWPVKDDRATELLYSIGYHTYGKSFCVAEFCIFHWSLVNFWPSLLYYYSCTANSFRMMLGIHESAVFELNFCFYNSKEYSEHCMQYVTGYQCTLLASLTAEVVFCQLKPDTD